VYNPDHRGLGNQIYNYWVNNGRRLTCLPLFFINHIPTNYPFQNNSLCLGKQILDTSPATGYLFGLSYKETFRENHLRDIQIKESPDITCAETELVSDNKFTELAEAVGVSIVISKRLRTDTAVKEVLF